MPIIGQISVGDGATFTPAVDSDGVISWTNNKNLTNPASVDIPQAVIDRYQLAPTSNPTFTGTVTAEDITASGTITGDLTGTASGNLPLSGGTMTGQISMNGNTFNLGANSSADGRIYNISNYLRLVGGNSTSNGSWIDVGSSSSTVLGITLNASNGNGTTKSLTAKYDGTLTWDGLLISGLLMAKSMSDTDFNTISQTGFYYATFSNSTTATNCNCPEGTNGILFVIDRDGTQTSVKQFYSRWGTQGSNDGNLYVREGNASTNSFGHWWKFTGTAV